VIALLQHLRRYVGLFKGKELANHGNQLLLLEKHGNLVDGWHVPDNKDLLVFNLAEMGNFLHSGGIEFAFATAGNLYLLGIHT
jgi:hypothetical protein